MPTVPTVGAVFKDETLREQCVVENIWMVNVPEASLYKLLRFQQGVEKSTRLVVSQDKPPI